MNDGLTNDEFREIQETVEHYAGIESVDRTEYDDILVVTVHGPAFRPANFEEIMGKFDMKITHVDFESREIEYTLID